MSFDANSFRTYLVIEKNNLNETVQQQPVLFERVGRELSQAIALKDRAKEDLDRIDAEIDIELREQFEANGIKATEALIKAKIKTDKKHQKSFDDYIKARQVVDELEILKDSFKQRSFMIRHLCDLYVASYYEDGSIRGTTNTEQVQYQERRKTLSEARLKKQT